jgi:hypothetical protein
MRLEARDWVSCCDTYLQGCCRGASVGGTRSKEAKDALARRCVVGCGLGKGRVRVCFVLVVSKGTFWRNRQWGAAPFTLAP